MTETLFEDFQGASSLLESSWFLLSLWNLPTKFTLDYTKVSFLWLWPGCVLPSSTRLSAGLSWWTSIWLSLGSTSCHPFSLLENIAVHREVKNLKVLLRGHVKDSFSVCRAGVPWIWCPFCGLHQKMKIHFFHLTWQISPKHLPYVFPSWSVFSCHIALCSFSFWKFTLLWIAAQCPSQDSFQSWSHLSKSNWYLWNLTDSWVKFTCMCSSHWHVSIWDYKCHLSLPFLSHLL